MAALLPFVVGGLLLGHLRLSHVSWRRGILAAAMLWGALVVGITEGLTAASALAFGPVAAAWGSFALVLAVGLCIRPRVETQTETDGWEEPSDGRGALRYLVPLTVLIVVIGTIALVAPPNTWDSLTYHLPRAMHWIQNRSVAHYPTANDRQLWNPPWCEFAIAQFHILSGGDRLDNLVQFGAMLVGLVAVSLVAAELHTPREAQLLAAVVAATIPMGILQASSTQTDWGIACWTVCFLVYTLDVWNAGPGERGWPAFGGAGLALGLALLSKGTAVIYCAPLGLWLVWGAWRRWRWHGAARLVLVGGLALLLTFPHYARNWRTFGDPVSAAKPRGWLTNASYDPRLILSNLLRNGALQLQTPSRRLDDLLAAGVVQLHKGLGIDANDPRSTYLDTKFEVAPYYVNEAYAGNPWHFLLSLAAVMVLGVVAFRARDGQLLGYILSIEAMALLQSALLRWQPWNSRLQLPIFVCAAPLVTVLLWRYLPPRAVRVVAAMLLLLAIPATFWGAPRPILSPQSIFKTPRAEMYYADAPERRGSFVALAQRLRSGGYRDVGLVLGYDTWEYPLWLELNPTGVGPIRLRHVATLDPAMTTWNWTIAEPPEALVVAAPNQLKELTIAGRRFVREWSSADLELFLPQPQGSP